MTKTTKTRTKTAHERLRQREDQESWRHAENSLKAALAKAQRAKKRNPRKDVEIDVGPKIKILF